MRDRLGSVSLYEVIMRDHKDAAEVLLKRHGTSIYAKDVHGVYPQNMMVRDGTLKKNKKVFLRLLLIFHL